MDVSSAAPKSMELVSLQLAKGQQQAEGAATLELLESAAESAPKNSTPSASVGSIINTTA